MEDHQPLTHDPLITTSTTPYQPPTSITTNTTQAAIPELGMRAPERDIEDVGWLVVLENWPFCFRG